MCVRVCVCDVMKIFYVTMTTHSEKRGNERDGGRERERERGRGRERGGEREREGEGRRERKKQGT